jgi:hypothetical protein
MSRERLKDTSVAECRSRLDRLLQGHDLHGARFGKAFDLDGAGEIDRFCLAFALALVQFWSV